MPKTSLRLLGFFLSAAALSSCQGSGTSQLAADQTAPAADPDAAVNQGGKSRADCNKQGLAWIALADGQVSVCGGALTTRPCCVSALRARYQTYAYMMDQALGLGYQLYNCEQTAFGTTAHFEYQRADGARGYYQVSFGDPVPVPSVQVPTVTLPAQGDQPQGSTTGTLAAATQPASTGSSATGTGAAAGAVSGAASAASGTAAAAGAAATAVPAAEQCDVDVNAKYRTSSSATTAVGSTTPAAGTTAVGGTTPASTSTQPLLPSTPTSTQPAQPTPPAQPSTSTQPAQINGKPSDPLNTIPPTAPALPGKPSTTGTVAPNAATIPLKP